MDHQGPVWLGGLVVLPDSQGAEHLVATYVKIKNRLEPVEYGLCEWDEKIESFVPQRVLWTQKDGNARRPDSLLVPDGQPVRFRPQVGQEKLLFVNPFAEVQMLYSYEAWLDPSSWTLPTTQEANGWRDGIWTDSEVSESSIAESTPVKAHRGDMAWSSRLGKWVMIFTQIGGESSFLGEVWYTSSESPLGPWDAPTPVVTHKNYSFYNPIIYEHALNQESPYLYFEGTYTAEFADHAEKTPRFDYNQVLYRLDLDKISQPHGR